MDDFLDFGEGSRKIVVLLDPFDGFGDSVVSMRFSFVDSFDFFVLKFLRNVDASLIVVEFPILRHGVWVLLNVVVVLVGVC